MSPPILHDVSFRCVNFHKIKQSLLEEPGLASIRAPTLLLIYHLGRRLRFGLENSGNLAEARSVLVQKGRICSGVRL